MFLIMSAAYVGQELQSEFGRIPPSFLPLGNKRLFQFQVALAPTGSKCYLTVPQSYKISEIDLKLLSSNCVEIIRLPDGLRLGESLVAALHLSLHSFDEPFQLLFGDTLFTELPHGSNFASTSIVRENYDWAVTTTDMSEWLQQEKGELGSKGNEVINGYFSFSEPRKLLRALAYSDWEFLKALNYYRELTNFKGSHSDHWLDFGHVNTYYISKASFTTQRVFNKLKTTEKWIEKASESNEFKIFAEAKWYKDLPHSLRHYTPQFLGDVTRRGQFSYRLEYLHLTALNELYVFAELPLGVWKRIIKNCVDFLKACREHHGTEKAPADSLTGLFQSKTSQRINSFCDSRNWSIDKQWCFEGQYIKLSHVIALSEQNLPVDDGTFSVLHGDFCFSNILYDFRANRIKTIDPRGLTSKGEQSIYGNIYYDIAKLSHSIIGLYDWIVSDRYSADLDDDSIVLHLSCDSKTIAIQDFFIKSIEEEFSLTYKEIIAMQIQLFLSMLPLHSDNTARQNTLFANAFRLYKLLAD